MTEEDEKPEKPGSEATLDKQKPVKVALDGTKRAGVIVKRGLEFFGRHPLITGVLGILGIVGLLISIQSYQVDRKEAQETTSQIEELRKNVTTVEERISAECASPPCWTLSEIMRASTIGRPKDLLDAKLPTAEFVKNNQFQYLLGGCRLYVEYRSDAVSYIASDLYRVERNAEGEFVQISCPFEVPQMLDPSSYPGMSDSEQYSKSNYPQFPNSNTAVQVQHMYTLRGPDVRISNACIYCGNYAEPYIELVMRGPHSSDFIDIYFQVHSSRFQSEFLDGKWETMKINFASAGPTPNDHWDVQTTDHCDRNVFQEVAPLLEFGVERVGIGRGQREWSGPSVLFCQ
ncbi:hypothetical protein EQG41_16105 [Billgrantia azerbaijanica]|nr:hypothetical protein EQG41_16105 [Halomonas azerbaijanica]